MVHCPECGTTLSGTDDVVFEDLDSHSAMSDSWLTGMAERFYTISCAHCDHLIGSGVAGGVAG